MEDYPVHALHSVDETFVFVSGKVVQHDDAFPPRESISRRDDRDLWDENGGKSVHIRTGEVRPHPHLSHAREKEREAPLTKTSSTNWSNFTCPMLPSVILHCNTPRADMTGITLYLVPRIKKQVVPVRLPLSALPQPRWDERLSTELSSIQRYWSLKYGKGSGNWEGEESLHEKKSEGGRVCHEPIQHHTFCTLPTFTKPTPSLSPSPSRLSRAAK